MKNNWLDRSVRDQHDGHFWHEIRCGGQTCTVQAVANDATAEPSAVQENQIETATCVEAGYEFLESANGFFLCAGSIAPEYFLRVLDRSSGIDYLHPSSPPDRSVRAQRDVIADLENDYKLTVSEFDEYKKTHEEKLVC